MKISLYPQKISSIIKFILKGIPFNFQIWQRIAIQKLFPDKE